MVAADASPIAPRTRRDAWLRPAQVAGIGLAAVAAHVFAVMTAVKMQPGLRVREELVDWDGRWYLALAQHGYPTHIPPGAGDIAQNTAGFYPLYAVLVRVTTTLTPLRDVDAALFVAVVAALGALVVIDRLAVRLCSEDVGMRTVVLIAFAPGAIVLSMAYSEGTFMLLAALCLLSLVDRRYVVAGVFGALGCLTRPNSVALVVACAAAVYTEWRRDDRDGSVVVAPILATAGFAALPVYHWLHADAPLAYWQSQHRGWGQGFDFGTSNLGSMYDVLRDPSHDYNLLLGTIGALLVAGGLVAMWYWRPPLPVVAYTLVVVALAFGSSQLVSTMRFAMTAFPLTIAYARILRNNAAFAVAVGVSAATMAALAAAATTAIYTP
jgi:hypothetical protein